MNLFEDIWIFHFDGGQLINIKKAPVVDFFGCNAPVGEAVGLIVKKFIEVVKTFWITLFPLNVCTFPAMKG